MILVIARLLDPSSELYVSKQWYPKTALPDLLGVPVDRVDDNRLFFPLPTRVVGEVGLAQLMGGNVNLVRSEPGQGSCFRMELPITFVQGTAIVENLKMIQLPEQKTQGDLPLKLVGRILIAEDGLDNQRLISFHLQKAGAIVDIADNGRFALEMLDNASSANIQYQLLLTDMQMPEMDGYMLARTLRNRNSDLPIVALTAHAMSEDQERCIDAGCNDYACKPIDKSALISICHRWMV